MASSAGATSEHVGERYRGRKHCRGHRRELEPEFGARGANEEPCLGCDRGGSERANRESLERPATPQQGSSRQASNHEGTAYAISRSRPQRIRGRFIDSGARASETAGSQPLAGSA